MVQHVAVLTQILKLDKADKKKALSRVIQHYIPKVQQLVYQCSTIQEEKEKEKNV